jgi:uncharacterized protein (DUF305 family)
MRHVHIIMLTLAIVLSATSLFAQTCPSSAPPCPPATCPPCISGCPVAPQAVAAALGAGPAADLQNLCGGDFDRCYIQSMYQLHATIIAFTTQGIEQTNDRNLRDLSIRIRDEQYKANEKLAAWARQCGICPLPVDYCKIQAVVNTLPPCGDCNYNSEYARTLSMLLSQQRDADQLAIAQSPTKQIRNMATTTVATTQREINSLLKWIGDKICPPTTCPTVTCPRPCSPQPVCPPTTTTPSQPVCPPVWTNPPESSSE